MSKADMLRENEQLRLRLDALERRRGSAAGTAFTVAFMTVIMAAFLLLLADRLGVDVPGVPPPQVVFSTPRAPSPMPSAAVIAPGPARIIEATFSPPAPVVVPTDPPAPPPTPEPIQVSAPAPDTAATAEQQGVIDRWLNGPPSSPTPTVWADFVQSFATPEPCNQFIGRVGAAAAACATPKE